MNVKYFISLTLVLALSPAGWAQPVPDGGGFPVPPPAGPAPQRGSQTRGPVIRPRSTPATNSPAALPAFPTPPPGPTSLGPTPAAAATPATPDATAAADGSIPGPGAPPAANPFVPNAPLPEQATISYHMNAPLEQFLEIYADLIGRTPLYTTGPPEGIDPTKKLTLDTKFNLTQSEAKVALETILGMNGITMIPIGDKFFKVVNEASASQAGGKIVTETSSSLPDAGRVVTEITQLKYADPAQTVALLQTFARLPGQNNIVYLPSTESLILRDYSENVKRMLELLEKLDISSPLVIKPRVIPIKYALASDIASALSQMGAGVGGSVGKSTSGTGLSRGSAGSGFGGGGGGGGGQPGSAVFGQATQPGMSTAAGGGRSNFQRNLGNIVNSAGGAGGGGGAGAFSMFGQTKIIADERTNSLLVFANDEDMKMIKDIIDKLDVVLAQVLIEAIILEVNLTDTKNTGFSILLNKQTSGRFSGAGGSQNLSSAASGFLTGSGSSSNATSTVASSTLASLPGGFSYFAKWGNDLDAVMEAVAGDSRISVLSRPRIQTSHAVDADLFIGNTVPYVTGTYNYGYGSGPSSQYTEKEVGITLHVLPLINTEGLVVMDIDQEIEQLGPDVQISGVGGVPTTTKRDAAAKVAVKSGETVILGGFISASRQKSDSGVPYLKDIPVLGGLFKSSSIQNLRTELIVLIRPTVLQTPEIAAKVASGERDKMAAVKQAEVEIRADEDARNATANAALKKQQARESKKVQRALDSAPPAMTTTNAAPDIENQ